MTKTRTQRGIFVFTVKEDDNGTLWIYPEPNSEEAVKLFGDDYIGFDLREAISYHEAQKFADELNDKITTVSVTKSLEH